MVGTIVPFPELSNNDSKRFNIDNKDKTVLSSNSTSILSSSSQEKQVPIDPNLTVASVDDGGLYFYL